jgi:hypothetical protein
LMLVRKVSPQFFLLLSGARSVDPEDMPALFGMHILGVAAGLISHNEGRLGKTLFTDGELGEKPTVTGVWDSEEEARAKESSMLSVRRPMEVVVLNCCVTDTNDALWASRMSTNLAKSESDRVSRSTGK